MYTLDYTITKFNSEMKLKNKECLVCSDRCMCKVCTACRLDQDQKLVKLLSSTTIDLSGSQRVSKMDVLRLLDSKDTIKKNTWAIWGHKHHLEGGSEDESLNAVSSKLNSVTVLKNTVDKSNIHQNTNTDATFYPRGSSPKKFSHLNIGQKVTLKVNKPTLEGFQPFISTPKNYEGYPNMGNHNNSKWESYYNGYFILIIFSNIIKYITF